MSLRAKLALTLAVLTASAVAAVGYLSFSTTRQRSLQAIDESFAAAGRLGLDPDDHPSQTQPGRGTAQIPGRPRGAALFTFQVIDVAGTVIDFTSDNPLPVDSADIAVANDKRREITRSLELPDGVHVRVRTIGVQGGALQIGRDLSEMDGVLRDLGKRLTLLGAAVVAVAAIAGWFLARQLTKGLSALTTAASEVSSTGRLDIDVNTSGRDEVGKLGIAFSSMLGALRTSREEQRRLVQDAGHELRTPLTSLRTNVDVMRKHANMPTEMRSRVLDDLDSEVAELTSLVEEVVAVASGAAAAEPMQPVSVAEVMEAGAERIRRRYSREITVSADASIVMAQRSQLERAVTNLLDNAAKFDSSAQPIELIGVNGRIAVRDHGPGIAEADLPRVFDRFYRSVGTRSLPGSGLGLSIVTEAAAALGGTTFAENHPDGGAIVGLQLPVLPAG